MKCGSSPSDLSDVAKVDENGDCIVEDSSSDGEKDSEFNYFLCCLPLIILLLLLLNFFGRQRVVFLDAEPEHTTSEPKCLEGTGTKEDPFLLKTISNVRPGSLVFCKEEITTKRVSEEEFFSSSDELDSKNHGRFRALNQHTEGQPSSRFATKLVRRLISDEDGVLKYQIAFDDRESPTTSPVYYETLFKVGNKSVYFKWTVEMKGYKRSKKQIEEAKAAKEAKAAEEKAAKEAKAAEEKAAKEAKAAEEKAAKEAKAAEEKAAKEAKAAEEKAAKEAKAAANKKPVTREVKKQEELKRVKSRAKTIDFKTLGEATSSTLKSEVKKGATTLEVANAKEFAEAGTAAISDESGSSVISWTGKDGNALTGVKGVTRVFGTATVVTVKDDLQVIKGIGPFIEEKLNALGITTYRQIANMDAKLETQVNEAIEFFPGRVKRDQWANQAKILLGEDVKLDEKALQQAEELERISKKAESIDFATLGVATLDQKDDLQTIKGIGPFIAEKLYALGIYTFEQVGNMTPEIEEQVNKAIEFFPGRVKRDEWAKQARQLHKNKK